MHTGNWRRIFCFVLLSMILSFLSGLEKAWARPTVGLVLSGGGARGAAHVGVIEVLEEMNIPVDFIAGTSMGSIIGGLYAIGTPPDEIEEMIRETRRLFTEAGMPVFDDVGNALRAVASVSRYYRSRQ